MTPALNKANLVNIHTSDPRIQTAIDRSIPEPAVAEISDEDRYFATNPAPEYLSQVVEQINEFIQFHQSTGKRIALVTSGGTTVPLENNTVRFIDNFSAGTRGATSAEQFLELDYAVIFLHRQFSLLPYSRHFSHTTNCFLDYMKLSTDKSTGQQSVIIDPEHSTLMKKVLIQFTKVKDDNSILMVPYTTVNQYLHTLHAASVALSSVSEKSVFYLAAAVSDFFLPHSKIPEHKIQSQGGGSKLEIDLDPVPKFLKRLVESWAPGAMIVSFKLETDKSILLDKARGALERYSHQLVIGNLLQTRKYEVMFVTLDDVQLITLSEEEIKAGKEIESLIVPSVAKLHEEWIIKRTA
ncbi:putative phosphopantothenoylcysteine synthetase [Nadsonia fulvescens var. elongata DSM 6958]|uniref:Putative phosphopantothenoylcysteine synthetase n=1 Tax=Nadsonia fulvescens var. elongata DSM 6958 TaxID=857566 RepID=A0A1E3PKC4_9ASCO|nr:putative phosphopantothenoylcysteine synthetase [Nadsonia fulvescens var. elongata DSM 6958]